MGHLWICDGGEEDMDMWKEDTHMWEEGVGEGCFVLQTPLKCWPLTNQSKKPHGGGFALMEIPSFENSKLKDA